MTDMVNMEAKILSKAAPNYPTTGRGIAWSFGVIAAYFASVFIYMMVYGVYIGITQASAIEVNPDLISQQIDLHLESIDFLIGFSVTELILIVPFILLISHFKTQSWKETLALRAVSLKSLLPYFLFYAAYSGVFALLFHLLDLETDEFMVQMAGTKSLGLAFALIICAPLVEELFFRGYLFKTLRKTRLGAIGTISLTSALFTLAHLGQYQALLMFELFCFSVFLGILRERTQSIIAPIILHAFNNALAVVLVVFLAIV